MVVRRWEGDGWTAPVARGFLGGMHLSGMVVCWEEGYV